MLNLPQMEEHLRLSEGPYSWAKARVQALPLQGMSQGCLPSSKGSVARRRCLNSNVLPSLDHLDNMAGAMKTCVECGDEFELKPNKPGFANRCPACSPSAPLPPAEARQAAL